MLPGRVIPERALDDDTDATRPDGSRLEVCVVGAGPRGLSVVERLCARERRSPSHQTVIIHVVDPEPAGAGAVWRTDQARCLLTNTVASQITVFTDDSVRIDGPIEPGPSLYDWARSLALLGPLGEQDRATIDEAQRLGPDSYPSRAFYGRYLRDCFLRVIDGAPEHVTVKVHRSRAVAIADTNGEAGGPQGVRLEDGTRLHHLDAIVLALGHVPTQLAPREARTASLARIHHLTYITPANPADVDLRGIEAGETVLLRGLGLNFFDYMALLTIGRGGCFVRNSDGLRYVRSGKEPRLVASSRRGVPHHARGANEKGAFGRYTPRLLTPEVVRKLRSGPVRFQTDLWPLIAAEVESVYYETLLGPGHDDFVADFLAGTPAEREALLDAHGVASDDRWDWDRLSQPCRGLQFADRSEYRAWLLEHLATDVREAKAGNVSGPLKAALDALRDLRNEIRQVVDHGGLDGDSYRDELSGWYTPLNAYLSIGPPVSRIEEMIALIEAGVLELTGPGTEILIDIDQPTFVAQSRTVPGEPVRAKVLIEARLPETDLARTADPLLRHMLDTEQCRAYDIPSASGEPYVTGGLAVTGRPYRVIDGRGRAHPRRFAYGIPTEYVHWVTAAGVRPGVDSVTIGDSDAIAGAVLSLAPAGVTAPVTPRGFTGVIV